MKKGKMVLAAGAVILVLSACGQTESAEEKHLIIERIDDAGEVQETETVEPADLDSAESTGEEPSATPKDDAPEKGKNSGSTESVEKEGQGASDEQEMLPDSQEQTEDVSEAGNPLFEAFLKNEIGVANPYVEGMELTVMDEKNYESEFEDAQKKYAYVDVNNDDNPELIFKISSNLSELMYILGVCDNELVCFDVFETHTKNIAFGVYDYGLVWEVRNYDGFEKTFYSYTTDGQPLEARRFTDEDGADIAAYEGEDVEWTAWQQEQS